MAGDPADIDWAVAELKRLEDLYKPGSLVQFDQNRGALLSAVEFLRLKAGSRSEFYLRASDAAKRMHAANAKDVVSWALAGWINFVESGLSAIPEEAQFRIAAATDLMEQVDTLLNDKRVVPAAPVMLAGAALEELLRAMIGIAGLKPRGKPGLNTYAAALRQADQISAQELKDVTAWAGLRNAAAHGDFDGVLLPHARLMAQGVNLFMQQHPRA